jgi:hypothetical protein
MAISARITKTMSMGGVNFNSGTTVTADAVIVNEESVAAGYAGTLTTRTSDTAGTVTTTATPTGITDGDRVDIYWSGGCCYGATVGTVSDKVIPFTLAAGDVLPVQTTAVMIVEPVLLDMEVLGTNVDTIMLYTEKLGQFAFVSSGPTDEYQVEVPAAGSWAWNEADGFANPITGDSIVGVYVSHGHTAAATMRVGVLYNN